ncbi:hypothetical protein [Microvirga sp. BSC39]|uniref:hypothetical protein n=1 Tax=Microvirga sp. BSC39 TaxID=1549810 RepID=UPI0004E97354|nr:hypothetical protein [Microvirga sp. BSC39]KFG68699.1 hypothetical protein JH26_14605 [Microvirga sp. BSC39]
MATFKLEIDAFNDIVKDYGGTGGHVFNIDALNEWAVRLGGSGGHRFNIDALNAIATRLGATAGHRFTIDALNAISAKLGGTGGHRLAVDALNVVADRPVGGGAPALTVLNAATSRMKVPGTYDLNTVGYDGTNTWHHNMLDFDIVSETNDLQLKYASWGVVGAGEATTNTTITVSAVVEYPIGGAKYPVTFGGAATQTLTTGVEGAWSDAIALPFAIPAGAKIRIYTLLTHAASAAYIPTYHRINPPEVSRRGSGAVPAVGSVPSAGAGVVPAFGPMAIRGKQAVAKPAVYIEGDSNTVDQTGASVDAFGNRAWGRVFSNNRACIISCYTGRPLSSVATSFTRRKAMMTSLGVGHAFFFHGTNDISDTRTLAEMQGWYNTIAQHCADVGVTPHFATLPPKTTLTTGAATLHAVNDWLRSQSGVGNFGATFELSDLCSTARNSNVWKGGYNAGGDGVHIAWSNTTVRDTLVAAFQNFANAVLG